MPSKRVHGRLFLLSAAFFLLATEPVWALGFESREELVSADKKVEIYAESINRDTVSHLAVAEGAVDIRSGSVHLQADRVELDEQTMDVEAKGHVILELGEDRLQAEHISFNLRTETGVAQDAQGFSQEYYFIGRRIEKRPEKWYHIDDGRVTSCQGLVPDWSIKSPDALIHVENYIYAWHPSLWIKKVPVLYAPYAFFPIKTKRATGMLIPRVRYTASKGAIVENSFFWAPVDNADATLTVDYYAKRGWRFGLESNYILAEDTKGKFTGFFIHDRVKGADRWDISFLHRHELPAGVAGLVNVNFESDRQYKSTYGGTIERENQEDMSSFVSLNRQWGTATLTVSADERKSLLQSTETTLRRLPELNFKVVDTKIGGLPLFGGGRFQVVDLFLDRDGDRDSTWRLDAAPRLSLPVAVGTWLTLTPSLEAEYTYYTNDTKGDPANRFIYNPRLEVIGPKLYRIYGQEDALPRFKHLIIPKVTYNYRPDVNQDDLFRFDAIDRVGRDNSITYSVTNQVLGKFSAPAPKTPPTDVEYQGPPERGAPASYSVPPAAAIEPDASLNGAAAPSGPGREADEGRLSVAGESGGVAVTENESQPIIREVLKFDLSQQYFLDKTVINGRNRSMGPVKAGLIWRFSEQLTFEADGWYDTYDNVLAQANYGFKWDDAELGGVSATRRFTRSSGIDYVEGMLVFKPWTWEFTLRSRYDIEDSSFVENFIEAKYTSQCWDATLSYTRTEDDYEYRFILNFKEIGTIISF